MYAKRKIGTDRFTCCTQSWKPAREPCGSAIIEHGVYIDQNDTHKKKSWKTRFPTLSFSLSFSLFCVCASCLPLQPHQYETKQNKKKHLQVAVHKYCFFFSFCLSLRLRCLPATWLRIIDLTVHQRVVPVFCAATPSGGGARGRGWRRGRGRGQGRGAGGGIRGDYLRRNIVIETKYCIFGF